MQAWRNDNTVSMYQVSPERWFCGGLNIVCATDNKKKKKKNENVLMIAAFKVYLKHTVLFSKHLGFCQVYC